MFFGSKNKKVKQLTLSAEGIMLYQGPLSEVPLMEETVLEKSEELFHDSNPCYIHRGAVRQHLTAKIEELLQSGEAVDYELLETYTGIEPIDYAKIEEV